MTLTTMSELAADHHGESQERLIREIESDFGDTGSLTRRDRMSPAVKAAMRAVPRHDFVEPSSRDVAYINRPLSIGHGQTISQPFIVALMTELIDAERDDRVLEIDVTGRVVYAIIDAVADDRFAGRPLYQAVLGPLRSMGYTYQVLTEVVEIESTSNISGLVLDTIDDELRFVAAGPRGTVGTTSLGVPSSLLEGPFSVLVDGQNAEVDSMGQTVSFTYDHQGQSDVVIRALPVG